MSSKTVMLDWSSSRFEVTEEGYLLIKQLIAAHQMCPHCRQRIDQAQRLLVGKKCLQCVLNDYPSLTFVGQQGENSDGDKIYAFVNKEGITLTSTENESSSPEEDVALSIETAGFSVPVSYKPFKATEEVRLSRSAWHVAGKLSQSVVVLRNMEFSNKRTEVDFIAYKQGETIEFNKRTTEHTNMLKKARTLAERTHKSTEDASLFEIIATLESAVYDAQLAFLAEEPAQEHNQIELFAEQTAEPEQQATEEPVQLSTRRKSNKQEE